MIILPRPRGPLAVPYPVTAQTPNVADHAAPADPAAIEPKVQAATAAASSSAILLPFVLWLLGAYLFRGEVPLPVQGFVGLVVTGGSTFVAGYLARHVDRAPVAP
jgi:hypothetical protein